MSNNKIAVEAVNSILEGLTAISDSAAGVTRELFLLNQAAGAEIPSKEEMAHATANLVSIMSPFLAHPRFAEKHKVQVDKYLERAKDFDGVALVMVIMATMGVTAESIRDKLRGPAEEVLKETEES